MAQATFQNGTAPSAPAAGNVTVYSKTDKKLYYKDDAGTEYLISGPSSSTVRLSTANGYGSTNTVIRRFTNTVSNVGSDITYADSATLGATFTINTVGAYAISYNDNFNAASSLGISVNSAQLTTAIGAINTANRLVYEDTAGSGFHSNVTIVLVLQAGDVIRAHSAGAATGGSGVPSAFNISKIG